MSLYSELVSAGVPVSNHRSDLYFRWSPESQEILKRFPLERGNATWFYNQAPPNKGEVWIDVPFAYDPFWEAVEVESARRRQLRGED